MEAGLVDAERRYCELRAEGRTLHGTAIRYGEVADLPGWRERFEPGAFGDVSAADVILNGHHDRARPLARTGGGGLTLIDGAEALRVQAILPDTRDADDVLKLVNAGVLRGFSIEFAARRESMAGDVRVIAEASLTGLAVVDRPAYAGSTVAARQWQWKPPTAAGADAPRPRVWL